MIRPKTLGLVCALAIGATAIADTVTVSASKDNTLYEDFLGRFSNGAGRYCFVGYTGGGFIRRGAHQFDVAGSIPDGSTINSATMKLHMSRTTSGAQTLNMHRFLADWGEAGSVASGQEGGGGAALVGDVTWLHGFFNTTLWTNEGGDFEPAASATLSVNGIGFYSWTSAQLAVDVQDMLDNPAGNFGWILIGDEFGSETAKRFDNKENGSPLNSPALMIDFTLPCVGDLNGDMTIDAADLGVILGQFGTAGPEGDINNDGVVDAADLGILLGVFGTDC